MKQLFFIKDSLRQRPVLKLLLLFLLISNIIFTLLVIRRQATEIEMLEEASIGAKRTFMYDGAVSIETKEANLSDIRSDIKKFRDRYQDYKGLTRVINEILEVARHNGLKIPVGNYSSEEVASAGMSKYSLALPVEGKYRQVKKYIYDIEALQYPIVIEELKLTSSKAKEGNIRLEIVMSIYYR